MRYLVYLLTLFFIGTAIAQNPTIVQGDYITNVFGPSNFVKNPNAQINTANVTVSNATVTRATTTPLVAKSEFTITTSTATGYADWDLRAFDAGMKNNNCEARFTYRGFTVGSTKAQILQGANVVAELTLVGDANNPKQASINFPCGDLSAVTKFRLQQASAALTGTNEIGGIYTGLATNMANVAQAEFIGSLSWPANAANDTRTGTAWQAFQTLGSVDPTIIGNVTSPNRAPRITVPNLKSGNYRIIYTGSFGAYSSTDIDVHCFFRITDGAASPTVFGTAQTVRSYGAISSNNGVWTPVLAFDFQYTGATQSMTFFLEASANSAVGNCRVETYTNAGLKIAVYRFPSSSELVVTPERQNVFGGVVYTGSTNNTLFSAAAEPTAFSSFNNAGWNQPTMLKGKAAVTTTNSGNDLGISIPNMPVGSYKVEISGLIGSTQSGDTGITKTSCNFKIVETTTSTDVAKQAHQDWSTIASTNEETRDWPMSFHGVFNNTAVSTRNFRLEAQKYEDTTTGNIGVCQAYTNASGLQTYISFLITPLDQPTNSALYVQGPVLGAQTGAAIPEGYVNEWSTRSVTDSSNRVQAGPVASTWYYPWTGELTLSAGNWQICYRVIAQISQSSSSTNTAFLQTKLANKTDSDAEVFGNGTFPTLDATISNFGSSHFGCGNVAITTSKTYRVGIRYLGNTGTPSVNNMSFRGDVVKSELFATRLN